MRHLMICFFALCAWSSVVNATPVIVERIEWGAQEPNVALMRTQIPRAIMIHHTGEKRNYVHTLEEKLRFLQEFSVAPNLITETKKEKPAWGDVPYHFYIDAHGRTGRGRDISFAGDTNTGYDTDGYIQIVVDGNFDKEYPNSKQLRALDDLVMWLALAYHIDPDRITGHNDHADTDCPGQNLKEYFDILRTNVGGGP